MIRKVSNIFLLVCFHFFPLLLTSNHNKKVSPCTTSARDNRNFELLMIEYEYDFN